MMKDKRNQLKQSTNDNKPLLFRAHSVFCLSALFNSGTCRVEAACTSLPDDFFLFPSVCSHVNVAVVYDVDVVSSIPMLEMEKVETSLSSLLGDVGDMVTVRERVDLAFGIVCAVEYFREQLRVAHGLISSRRVPWTSDLGGPIYCLIGNLQHYTSINLLEQAVENSFTRDCTCPSSLHVSLFLLPSEQHLTACPQSCWLLAKSSIFSKLKKSVLKMQTRQESQDTFPSEERPNNSASLLYIHCNCE